MFGKFYSLILLGAWDFVLVALENPTSCICSCSMQDSNQYAALNFFDQEGFRVQCPYHANCEICRCTCVYIVAAVVRSCCSNSV
jgi:hypothetical protein